jgi:acyl-CoA thioesterase FadM
VYPYLRWLGVVFRRRRHVGLATLFDEARLRFHVWPGDLDFFGHLNNGRYLTLMDSGRFDLIMRVGLFPHMKRNRWITVIGGATIQFRRPLRPFARFDLVTKLVGWDAKWFYIEQWFESEGKRVADATVRGVFRAPGRTVPPQEVLEAVGYTGRSPPLPSHVSAWARIADDSRATPQRV